MGRAARPQTRKGHCAPSKRQRATPGCSWPGGGEDGLTGVCDVQNLGNNCFPATYSLAYSSLSCLSPPEEGRTQQYSVLILWFSHLLDMRRSTVCLRPDRETESSQGFIRPQNGHCSPLNPSLRPWDFLALESRSHHSSKCPGRLTP